VSELLETRILHIAAAHLRLHGAQYLRVTAIARELGMTHSTIYRYFPTKEALIDAVIAQWLSTLEKRLKEIADSPDPADDKLERFILALAHYAREKGEKDPSFFKCYILARQNNAVSVANHRATLRRLFERILEEGENPGPFRIKNQERAYAFVVDSLQRFIHPELIYELKDLAKQSFEARLNMLIKIIVKALQAGVL
jgi:AcrR family transcriptional regulator